MNENKFNLSEKEKKFLIRFEKNVERIYITYISVGLSLAVVIVGLIIGITTLDHKGGFLMAIIFSGISINMFLLSRSYQKLYTIIKKMKQHITEIEKIKTEK
jgi:hypothetical protein